MPLVKVLVTIKTQIAWFKRTEHFFHFTPIICDNGYIGHESVTRKVTQVGLRWAVSVCRHDDVLWLLPIPPSLSAFRLQPGMEGFQLLQER